MRWGAMWAVAPMPVPGVALGARAPMPGPPLPPVARAPSKSVQTARPFVPLVAAPPQQIATEDCPACAAARAEVLRLRSLSAAEAASELRPRPLGCPPQRTPHSASMCAGWTCAGFNCGRSCSASSRTRR